MPLKYILALCVSYAAVMVLMPSFINFLKKLSFRQSVSEYALADDKKKAGTPIMGGILFIVIPVIIALIASPDVLKDMDTWIVFVAFIGYGLIGFIDDYLIAVQKKNDGLTPKQKFGLQLLLAIVFFLIYRSHAELHIRFPFMSHPLYLGWGYFILVLFMFTGTTNAVNLTDGMDGLAAGVSFIAIIPFIVFCWIQKRVGLVVFLFALEGALLGYLHYNKKPARVFMGDTGSLALGGVLAALAMITKHELLLVIIAGVPVIETLCVIIQITSVKLRHKKVFPYTPIHYAFRIKGMPEKSIVIMFWLAEAVFAAIGLVIGII